MKQQSINVIVVISAGSIGQAIARRVGAGHHILLADLKKENADAAAKTLSEAGFEVSTATVDVYSKESASGLDYTILRPIWFTNTDEVDYEITRKGKPEKGSVISQKSLATFITSIIESPEKYSRENLGINRPGS